MGGGPKLYMSSAHLSPQKNHFHHQHLNYGNHHLVIFDGGEDGSVDGDHHLVIFGGGVDENG